MALLEKVLDKLLRGGFTEYSLYLTQSRCVLQDFDRYHTYEHSPAAPALYSGLWTSGDAFKLKNVVKTNESIDAFLKKQVFLVLQDHVKFDEADVDSLLRGRIESTKFLT